MSVTTPYSTGFTAAALKRSNNPAILPAPDPPSCNPGVGADALCR